MISQFNSILWPLRFFIMPRAEGLWRAEPGVGRLQAIGGAHLFGADDADRTPQQL